jgi:hypothetical protein
MLEYVHKINKFRATIEPDVEEELIQMYEESYTLDMYVDVEFFNLGRDWRVDIYISSQNDEYSKLFDRLETDELINVEELNEIEDSEEVGKILFEKINEMYENGYFANYINEYVGL